MYNKAHILSFSGIFYLISWICGVESFWEYAVTTNEEIRFYSKNWTLLQTAAHQFNDLSAISFDEIKDTIYFSDTSNKHANIFALKVFEDQHFNYKVNELVKKQLDEEVHGVAFDPIENTLYWSDSKNRQIHRWNLNKIKEKDTVWMTFGGEVPRGIAIDVCNRKLYWTNVNTERPTIERASLEDPSDREVLVKDGISFPAAIFVDSFNSRFYWTDYSVDASSFNIDSMSLNASEKKTHIYQASRKPLGLTVDDESIYFTDTTFKVVIGLDKITNQEKTVASFRYSSPKGIVARQNFDMKKVVDAKCQQALRVLKEKLATEKLKQEKVKTDYCLNGGTEIKEDDSQRCKCPKSFTGVRCEIDVCKNYCLNGGMCTIQNGAVTCQNCNIGFTGNRCEKDVCHGFCMNGGICDLKNGKPICSSCPLGFSGEQCEMTRPKREIICQEICADTYLDEDLKPICERCNQTVSNSVHLVEEVQLMEQQQQCINTSYNKSLVFTSLSIMGSLLLLTLIIFTLYKIHKPIRPRIKKTYVVQKNLPSCNGRPPATEQCEIIIENCCNMNICETPCFDPKVLQGDSNSSSPSAKGNCKEDKKQLLSNMEGNGELF